MDAARRGPYGNVIGKFEVHDNAWISPRAPVETSSKWSSEHSTTVSRRSSHAQPWIGQGRATATSNRHAQAKDIETEAARERSVWPGVARV